METLRDGYVARQPINLSHFLFFRRVRQYSLLQRIGFGNSLGHENDLFGYAPFWRGGKSRAFLFKDPKNSNRRFSKFGESAVLGAIIPRCASRIRPSPPLHRPPHPLVVQLA